MCRELIISLVLISCGLYVVSLLQAMSYQTHYGNVYITIDVQCNLLLMTGNLLLSMSIGLANMFFFCFFYNVWLPIEFCIKSVLVCTEHRYYLLQVTGLEPAKVNVYACSMYYNVYADQYMYCSDVLWQY